MRYPEALEFLNSFLNYEQVVAYRYPEAFSLDRIRWLLSRLGNPHRRYLTLHVAGTKGKGSTCAFAASILKAAGYRVGLYTSPHLISFRERIQVNGQPIPEEALAQAVEALAQAVEALAQAVEALAQMVSRIRPFATRDLTFFEVTTACAFHYFALEKVDVAVIEVGMGGRLDATNVLQPEVTAITPISLDHTTKLGNTLSLIAREKAGIIKPGVPVVVAPQPEEAWGVIEKTAKSRGAPVYPVAQEIRIEGIAPTLDGTSFCLQSPHSFYPGLKVSLLGRHQLINAAVAIRMLECLSAAAGSLSQAAQIGSQAIRVSSQAFRISPGAIRVSPQAVQEGLAQTVWPGRCQWVEGEPPMVLDGAQNAASCVALRSCVEELFPGRGICLVLGVSLEKDLLGIASVLGPWADRLILTQADVPRAESPERLKEIFFPWHPNSVSTASVAEALELARSVARPNDLIVVTGSLFVVGEALPILKRQATSPQVQVAGKSSLSPF